MFRVFFYVGGFTVTLQNIKSNKNQVCAGGFCMNGLTGQPLFGVNYLELTDRAYL